MDNWKKISEITDRLIIDYIAEYGEPSEGDE